MNTPPRQLTAHDVTAHGGVITEDGNVIFLNVAQMNKAIAAAQAIQWISTDTKPTEQTPVLVVSNGEVVRAMWVPRFSREDNSVTDDFGEYNEADDTYYWQEGWYEWNEQDEMHWELILGNTPTAWAPMPPVPDTIPKRGA